MWQMFLRLAKHYDGNYRFASDKYHQDTIFIINFKIVNLKLSFTSIDFIKT